GLKALELAYRTGTSPLLARKIEPLPTKAFGLTFPNPVGLAAGMDKNGAHIDALLALGFGFIEIGTITPRAQPGNPKPRMFRLPQHKAVINRLGFNNLGVDALVANVERAQRRSGLLGINIGRNKDTSNERAASDYLYCLERVYPLADYITVNISSPNTAGLRELQEEQALRQLVGALRESQEELGAQHGKRVPMLVKIAPDLSDEDIDAVARVLRDLSVDGVIATNTTVSRITVQDHRLAHETGGLSGAPLMNQSTMVMRKLRTRLPDSIPVIGVGGILSGADAVAKMSAGATLVQCYTGLVYRGPELVGECVDAIRRRREHRSGGPVPPA
ncbi:MAG: quinone-dependent dihydroorotate dehydrogenase, partial [Pseudoxanthomonas sp.]